MHFVAEFVISMDWLCVMIPHNVRGWFNSTINDALQMNCAASFHISVGVTDEFGSWYCRGKETHRESEKMLHTFSKQNIALECN